MNIPLKSMACAIITKKGHLSRKPPMCDHLQIVPRAAADAHFSMEESMRHCTAIRTHWNICGPTQKDALFMANETECLWIRHNRDHGVHLNISLPFSIRVQRWAGNRKEWPGSFTGLHELVCPWR